MNKKEAAEYLRYPLYGLYHIRNLEQASVGGYMYDIVPEYTKSYSEEVQIHIIKAIDVALDDPAFDYEESLPDLPFSKKEKAFYLEETKKRIIEVMNKSQQMN